MQNTETKFYLLVCENVIFKYVSEINIILLEEKILNKGFFEYLCSDC